MPPNKFTQKVVTRYAGDTANLPSVEKALTALLPSSACAPSTESMERTAS